MWENWVSRFNSSYFIPYFLFLSECHVSRLTEMKRVVKFNGVHVFSAEVCYFSRSLSQLDSIVFFPVSGVWCLDLLDNLTKTALANHFALLKWSIATSVLKCYSKCQEKWKNFSWAVDVCTVSSSETLFIGVTEIFLEAFRFWDCKYVINCAHSQASFFYVLIFPFMEVAASPGHPMM